MKKFIEELKKFLKVFKYIAAGLGAFALSAFAVDKFGAESTVAQILAYFWVAVLIVGILFFTGLGSPLRKFFFKLFKIAEKKDEVSDKKE